MNDVAERLMEAGRDCGRRFYAQVLRRARTNRGLYQKDAGEKLGVSDQTVRNWESGRAVPDDKHHQALADLYDLSADLLLEVFDDALRHATEDPKPLIVNPDRLREARERVGMSQAQVAERIGVLRNSVTRYENGTSSPEYDILVRIAALYGQPIEYFISGATIRAAHERLDEAVAELSEPEIATMLGCIARVELTMKYLGPGQLDVRKVLRAAAEW